MEVITNADELIGIQEATAPEVVSALRSAERVGLRIIAAMDGHLYYVKPNNRGQNIKLRELANVIGEKCFRAEITDAVYETYQERKRAEADEFVDKDEQEIDAKVLGELNAALSLGASDLHINVRRTSTHVRKRIYGSLVESSVLSKEVGEKIVASLFSSSAKTPYSQANHWNEGKFYHSHKDDQYLVRLSKLRLSGDGSTCKLRFRKMGDTLGIREMGYTERQLETFNGIMRMSAGLLVITGAVNSGKSTTITALLRDISPEYAVLEVSDAVEVTLPNVEHVELPRDGDNVEAEIKGCLDTVARQDSDYLVIGDMRNPETAGLAQMMAQQGKFVMTTGHAPDSITFYRRMVSPGDLKMSQGTVLAPDFLRGMVSQALVDTLCPHCSTEMPDEVDAQRNGFSTPQDAIRHFRGGLGPDAEGIRFFKRGGCESCAGKGRKGLTVVAEVMTPDDDFLEFLASEDYRKAKQWRVDQGILSKTEHGLTKVLAGIMDPFRLGRRVGSIGPDTISTWKRKPVPGGPPL